MENEIKRFCVPNTYIYNTGKELSLNREERITINTQKVQDVCLELGVAHEKSFDDNYYINCDAKTSVHFQKYDIPIVWINEEEPILNHDKCHICQNRAWKYKCSYCAIRACRYCCSKGIENRANDHNPVLKKGVKLRYKIRCYKCYKPWNGDK